MRRAAFLAATGAALAAPAATAEAATRQRWYHAVIYDDHGVWQWESVFKAPSFGAACAEAAQQVASSAWAAGGHGRLVVTHGGGGSIPPS